MSCGRRKSIQEATTGTVAQEKRTKGSKRSHLVSDAFQAVQEVRKALVLAAVADHAHHGVEALLLERFAVNAAVVEEMSTRAQDVLLECCGM